MIILGDLDDDDAPIFEFYHLANDWNEQSPLAQDSNHPYEINTALLDAMGGEVRRPTMPASLQIQPSAAAIASPSSP